MIPAKSDRKGLSARRLVLLASVAATAIAVVASGPSNYGAFGLPSLVTPAHAAGIGPSPSGFADIVAKVKPAVISVRVKVDETEKMTPAGGHFGPRQSRRDRKNDPHE